VRARRQERREEGDDGWAPPVSEGGGRARLRQLRARGKGEGGVGRGKRREEEGDGPDSAQEREGGFLGFFFYKTFSTLFIS
jgi:hypothetical protein